MSDRDGRIVSRHLLRRTARKAEQRLQRQHPESPRGRFVVEQATRGPARWVVRDCGEYIVITGQATHEQNVARARRVIAERYGVSDEALQAARVTRSEDDAHDFAIAAGHRTWKVRVA